jgi:hypothetical protein
MMPGRAGSDSDEEGGRRAGGRGASAIAAGAAIKTRREFTPMSAGGDARPGIIAAGASGAQGMVSPLFAGAGKRGALRSPLVAGGSSASPSLARANSMAAMGAFRAPSGAGSVAVRVSGLRGSRPTSQAAGLRSPATPVATVPLPMLTPPSDAAPGSVGASRSHSPPGDGADAAP